MATSCNQKQARASQGSCNGPCLQSCSSTRAFLRRSSSQLLVQLPESYHGRVQKVRKLTLRRGQTPRELGRLPGRTPSPQPRADRAKAEALSSYKSLRHLKTSWPWDREASERATQSLQLAGQRHLPLGRRLRLKRFHFLTASCSSCNPIRQVLQVDQNSRLRPRFSMVLSITAPGLSPGGDKTCGLLKSFLSCLRIQHSPGPGGQTGDQALLWRSLQREVKLPTLRDLFLAPSFFHRSIVSSSVLSVMFV